MIATLTGDNHYVLNKELKKLTNAFIEQYSDVALESYDGEELEPDKLESAVQTLPFLSERRMVVVRDGSSNKALAGKLEDILAAVNDATDVIFAEKHPDKRSSYYKTLKQKTEFREFSNAERSDLPRWLSEQAKELGGTLGAAEARFLAERIGTNQMTLINEIKKLVDYDPEITRETIELLTEPTPQSKIFDLLDAAFSGNAKRALELYEDQRKQRMEPQKILAMIGWQLHIMAVVKAGGQKSPDQIAKEAKLNPFVARKTQNLVRKMSTPSLKRLVRQALGLDVRMKSVSIDTDDALKSLIVSISES